MKKLLAGLMMLFVLTIPMTSGITYAQFDPLAPACENIEDTDPAKKICLESDSGTDIISGEESIIVTIANVLSVLAGIIAVVIIIIAGITLMTSNGDSAKFAKSRNTIIYTVVGLFAVLMSRTIVVFIIDRIST